MVIEVFLYFLAAGLLVLACVAAWVATLFTLPGTWLVLGLAALFALWEPGDGVHGIGWSTVAVLGGLAVLGEVLEFLAGAAGAAKRGGSRRAMLLAVGGAAVGSIAGALVLAVPVPVFGPLIGAVGGGAAGAFAGAYLGETWKGRAAGERLEISKGALVGRLLGTAGKLVVGAVMVVIVACDALFL